MVFASKQLDGDVHEKIQKAKHETLAGASAWLVDLRAFQHLKIE